MDEKSTQFTSFCLSSIPEKQIDLFYDTKKKDTNNNISNMLNTVKGLPNNSDLNIMQI